MRNTGGGRRRPASRDRWRFKGGKRNKEKERKKCKKMTFFQNNNNYYYNYTYMVNET